ncbi:INO80 complex subunit B-like [Halichondria panicea]|uniref:INO80 complex subunit B-like n=1 Tax=Halichondria panicea TaxID=6063 RepID=UPI00312B70BA
MGKKRTRDDSSSERGNSKKKHKKNKHKSKHHKEMKPPITLKIKLGDKYMSTTGDGSFLDDVSSVAESEPLSLADQSVGVFEDGEGSDISVGKDEYEEVGTSGVVGDDDEEAWLEALESGGVDERGYLPAKKASTLTARQRALLGGEDSEALMELPLTKKGTVTEEDVLKKMEKNQKRRVAALKRKEKRKSETVRKLIEKTTKKKDEDKPKLVRAAFPHIRYITSTRPLQLTTAGSKEDVHSLPLLPPLHSLLSLPPGMDYPITRQASARPPPLTLCSVEGCNQVKKYSDSCTSLPLCSLQCYQKLRATDSHSIPVTS